MFSETTIITIITDHYNMYRIVLVVVFLSTVCVIVSTDDPEISGEKQIEISSGETFRLNCTIQSHASLVWTFNTEEVSYQTEGVTLTIERGNPTIATFTKSNAKEADSGNYTCYKEGEDKGSSVYVTVKPAQRREMKIFSPEESKFSNLMNLNTAIVEKLGGLMEVAYSHALTIQELDNFTSLQYEKLEKWISDMQTRIRLDHAESSAVVEGHGNKIQDLSSQLDSHESDLNTISRKMEKLETLTLPGASLGHEIESLRRDVYNIQTQQLTLNQTTHQLLQELESIRSIVQYLEEKIDQPEIVYCEDDEDCPRTHYCSITRKGNICELKSPPGTFCLRGNKCQSGTCKWTGRCA